MYSAFCQRIQSAVAIIIKVSENHHSQFVSPRGATGQVHTLSALRFFYISYNQHLPDVLRSTMQIEIEYLAQVHKHAGHSRAQTHNIDELVMSRDTTFSEAENGKISRNSEKESGIPFPQNERPSSTCICYNQLDQGRNRL